MVIEAGMIRKIKAAMVLFKRGQVVADPVKWKNRQITSTMIVAAIYAVIEAAGAFGYDLKIDQASIDSIAVGIIAAVNVVFTFTTSEKVGV